MKKFKKYLWWFAAALPIIILVVAHIIGIIAIFDSITIERLAMVAIVILIIACVYISEQKKLIEQKYSRLIYYTTEQRDKRRETLDETEDLLTNEQQKLDAFECIKTEKNHLEFEIEFGIEMGTITKEMPEYTEKLTEIEKLKNELYECEREMLWTKRKVEELSQKKWIQTEALHCYNNVLYFIEHS